jgi:hypothetical protein
MDTLSIGTQNEYKRNRQTYTQIPFNMGMCYVSSQVGQDNATDGQKTAAERQVPIARRTTQHTLYKNTSFRTFIK